MTVFVDKLCGKKEIRIRKITFFGAVIQSFIQNVHSLWITYAVDAFFARKTRISIAQNKVKENFILFLHRFLKLIHISAPLVVDNHRIEAPNKFSTRMKSDVDSSIEIRKLALSTFC